MPQERKKRGRRQERKQEHDVEEQEALLPLEESKGNACDFVSDQVKDQGTFFGLLDEQELAYFSSLHSLISANQFGDDEEKEVFISNTYAEIQGRELKIATSPSSRFFEKLMFLLDHDQLLAISTLFLPHFIDLMHRPSASFCCETLILKLGQQASRRSDAAVEAIQAICDQVRPMIIDIVSHPLASHVLRTLLLILAGSSFGPDATIKLLNKPKEDDANYQKAVVIMKEVTARSIESFRQGLAALIIQLATDLNPPSAQNMALSPVSGPAMQIVVEYELITQKNQDVQIPKSTIQHLLPNEDIEGENLAFLQRLLKDPAGSHMMEILVTKSPGRIFKRLHRSLFDGHILALAKGKGPVTFVLVKAFERFSAGNLEKAVQELEPGLVELVRNGETNVLTSLITQCRKRQVSVKSISEAFDNSYGNQFVKEALDLEENGQGLSVHISVMMQTMLEAPDELASLVVNGLLVLSVDQIVGLSKQQAASRLLQAALVPTQPVRLRKHLIANLLGRITELGQDNVASHVVDALWAGSSGQKFLRDRLINEILANEQLLRQTIPGRAVCRNWRKWSRETELEERPLTGLDKARKRHALTAEKNRKKARSN